MSARAYWRGYLKLSLVSCPICVYPATSENEKVSFHQINQHTGNRIRYRKVDAETGEDVAAEDIVKGYEIDKGRYLTVTADELETIQLESTHVLEITEFVPKAEVPDLYRGKPYYIAPDGAVGQQAFAVIREALRKKAMIGIGTIVFRSREQTVAVEPQGLGLVVTTLYYPHEVRQPDDYFESIEQNAVAPEMLELAEAIVDLKKTKFEPAKFKDRYENAVVDLLRKKQRGEKTEPAKVATKAPTGDLIAQLRASLAGSGNIATKAPPKAAAKRKGK